MGITYNANSYICDYYICFNKKSEFIYLANKNVEAMRLSKYVLQGLFNKYPAIGNDICEKS